MYERHHLSYRQQCALLHANPNTPIRISTLQNIKAWERTQHSGLLTGPEPDDDTIHEAYDWMRGEMKTRIDGYSGNYPVWAYPKPMSTRKPLAWSHHSGERYVRITAHVPRKRLLLSRMDFWEMRLNNGPCFESDDPIWDDGYDRLTRHDIERTWHAMFIPHPFISHVQLCVDRIFLSDITQVRLVKNPNQPRSIMLYHKDKNHGQKTKNPN